MIQGVSVGRTTGIGVCRILVLKLTVSKTNFTETRYKSPVLVSPDRLTHPNFRDQPTYVFREINPAYCVTYMKEMHGMIKTFLILHRVMHSTSKIQSLKRILWYYTGCV